MAEAAGASPQVPETIEFHDIAGLVRGASAGEGLGNRFLAEIRETDAICHVVRAHGDERIPHPEGRDRPASPTPRWSTPSCCSPISSRRSGVWSGFASRRDPGRKEAAAERDWLERVVEALGRGEPARGGAGPGPGAGWRRRTFRR